MRLLRTCSDQELVDAVGRFERFRVPVASVLLTMAFITMVVVAWLFVPMFLRMHSHFENDLFAHDDSVLREYLKNTYEIGLMMGGMLVILVGGSIFAFATSLAIMFGGRRERLLMDCYQKFRGSAVSDRDE